MRGSIEDNLLILDRLIRRAFTKSAEERGNTQVYSKRTGAYEAIFANRGIPVLG